MGGSRRTSVRQLAAGLFPEVNLKPWGPAPAAHVPKEAWRTTEGPVVINMHFCTQEPPAGGQAMALREPPWRRAARWTDGTVVCTLDSKHLPRWDGQWWGLGKQPNNEQARSLDSKGLDPQPGPWARSSWHPCRPFYALCAMVGKEGEHLDPTEHRLPVK